MDNKEDVLSLNYRRKKLTNLPKEILNNKDTLIELDVSGNNFNDFYSIVEDLKKFTKLKKLKINIYTQEQAKYLIDSMPNLEFLNDEAINDDLKSEEPENLNEYKDDEEAEEIIINIPLINLVDKNFEAVFKQFKEFYSLNKEKEDEFQKIIEDFNNLGKQLQISQDKNMENLGLDEIKKKMELYMFLYDKLNKIKDEINKNNSGYNQDSVTMLYNIIEENEKIKNQLNSILLKQQNKSMDKVKKNKLKNNSNDYIKNNNTKNKLKANNKSDNYLNQENISQKKEKNTKNKINNNQRPNKIKKLFNKKLNSIEQNSITNSNIFNSNMTQNNRSSNETPLNNKSFNKYSDRMKSSYFSRKVQNRTTYSENKKSPNSFYLGNKIKKYSKQANLIKNYDNPNIKNLLIKSKPTFDTLNIFEDEYNDQIYKDELNTRIININSLLEIINQIYKIRNNRIEKQKEGVYNKGTLEQDLYAYLKAKYGLKNLIIEWSINILSSIQSYIKLNGEVYLFASILRNELDEDSIEILYKIKKTVNNILYLIYDYDINMIEKIKNNKEFIRENEWKTISKCLYSDDEILRELFINKVSNFIDELVKGPDLIEKTGRKILFCDYMNLLITFNLKLRKKYLHNLFLLFSQEDKKRTGIINLESFKNIVRNCGIINDEEKINDVLDDLIEIADKEGSGQITFNDTVQCLDNLDLIMDEGKVKFLDKLSKMSFKE